MQKTKEAGLIVHRWERWGVPPTPTQMELKHRREFPMTMPTESQKENLFNWRPISEAPFDCDLELAVISRGEVHALVFPCRRILAGWVNAESKKRIEVQPTHWRERMQTP